jgi:hypothetical protein
MLRKPITIEDFIDVVKNRVALLAFSGGPT